MMSAQLGVDTDAERTARAPSICSLTIWVAVAMVVLALVSFQEFRSSGTKETDIMPSRNMETTTSIIPNPLSLFRNFWSSNPKLLVFMSPAFVLPSGKIVMGCRVTPHNDGKLVPVYGNDGAVHVAGSVLVASTFTTPPVSVTKNSEPVTLSAAIQKELPVTRYVIVPVLALFV